MDHVKRKPIPIPGQRILRSVVAVWLCLGVYLLRGRQGIPFYSLIAALQCMQPYTGGMRTMAKNRLGGTLIGAFWGLVVLLLELRVINGDSLPDEMIHFLLVGLFIGVVLYFTVLIRMTATSYFSTVVFLSITVSHIGDANPYIFVLNRVLDTTIGVVVAELVNRLHLPRRRNTDILFVSAINDTIIASGKRLSPYAKVELNRLIQDGAQFTIFTLQTPPVVRELLDGVDMRLPIIVMDGAAIFDLKKAEYVHTVCMQEHEARRMVEFLDAADVAYFSNTVAEHLLVTHCGKLGDGALKKLFESKRTSPHRVFLRHRNENHADMLYFLVLDETARMEALYAELLRQPWAGDYRIVWDETKRTETEACLKIYSAAASRDATVRKLAEMLKPKEVVTFGSVPGECDVLIESTDRDRMVKELKRRFEPVDLRGWRNILRLK